MAARHRYKSVFQAELRLLAEGDGSLARLQTSPAAPLEAGLVRDVV